ncbi:MAG: hypothetical protein ACXABY_23135 [Candidatus Thorarchaeota archaeon]|jgi:hypothetical protein
MFKTAKYIIIEYNGHELPIIFSPLLAHADVAKPYSNKSYSKVVSAGFVYTNAESYENGPDVCFYAYGKSVSLGITSREQDAEIIGRVMSL